MKRTAAERVSDIAEHIDKIPLATHGKTLETLEEDYILVAAVVRWLEIIGEATKYVPNSIKEKYPNIPWRQMAGMRDVAIHDYSDLKIERIFNTIQNDIPTLKKQIDAIEIE